MAALTARWQSRCRHCDRPITRGDGITRQATAWMHNDCAAHLLAVEQQARNASRAAATRRRQNRR